VPPGWSPRPPGARIPLERLKKEIKHRTAVGGIFPNRVCLIRLVGMDLFEKDDEWQDGRRYLLPESMARIDAVPGVAETETSRRRLSTKVRPAGELGICRGGGEAPFKWLMR
jgi:hypothetical protein